MAERIAVRLGSLTEPFYEWCKHNRHTPASAMRIAVAKLLDKEAPAMPVGRPWRTAAAADATEEQFNDELVAYLSLHLESSERDRADPVKIAVLKKRYLSGRLKTEDLPAAFSRYLNPRRSIYMAKSRKHFPRRRPRVVNASSRIAFNEG